MSADFSDLALGEDETERAMARTGSDEQHRAFVEAETKAQQQRVDSMMQRWSVPPQHAERAGERREFVVRAAKLDVSPEAVERANRPRNELSAEQLQLQETIGQKLFYEFSRELAALATHLGVRLFEEGSQEELRLLEKVFDVAAPTWMAERHRLGGGLLGGAAFGELFKKKDPRTYKLMTEGWNPTFLPATSMEARNVAASKPATDEDKVIIKKRTPVRPTPAPVGPLESDSTDEALVALAPNGRGARHTTVAVVPPELRSGAGAIQGVPAEEPKGSDTKKMIAVGVIAALIAGVGGVWFVLSKDNGAGPAPTTTVTTTVTNTQVVTVVKTVEVPASAPPVDTNTAAVPNPPTTEASSQVSAPTVNTGVAPFPSVKTTAPSSSPTPSAPTTTPAPSASGSHTPKFGGK